MKRATRIIPIAALVIWGIATATSYAWQTSRSTSPVDDSETIALIQEARGLYTDRYGNSGRANLQILCEENTTGIAIVFPELYTSDNGGLGKVTFRADQNEAFSVQMIASNDHSSLALISGDAIRTIKKILDANTLFAQTLTVNEPIVRVEFDVSELTRLIAPVRENCGW